MDWKEIMGITNRALEAGRDITITIESDGTKSIVVTVPQQSIIETNMRTKYIPEAEVSA